MNIFTNIRRDYGQNTVRRIRELESYEKKIARHRNHRVFSLRCRDENVTPPSLKLRHQNTEGERLYQESRKRPDARANPTNKQQTRWFRKSESTDNARSQ